MYVSPAAPLPIGAVIDDAIRLYRASFRSCLPISLVSGVLLGAVSVLLTWRMSQSGLLGAAQTPAGALRMYSQPDFWGLSMLAGLVRFAAFGAVLRSQYALARTGTPLPASAATSGMLARLLPAVAGYILMTLVLIVGYLLLLVPGIWLTGALSVWAVPLFCEGIGPVASMNYSRELVRGHWWRTCTILTVALILMLVFSSVIGAIAGAATVLISRDPLLVQLMLQIVGAVANIFLLSMLPAAVISVYHDLKLRREGGDLAARLGALEAG